MKLSNGFGTMIEKIKFLFGREKKLSVGSYLKKLSINRQDLIKEISDVDLDSPVNAYLALAILLREKGEYYRSLKILERLKREELSDDEKKLVVLNLALVYRAAGFIDRAEEALKEGIKLYPSESFFYYELAQLKKMSGKLEEAVELLENAIKLKEEFRDDLVHTKLYLANDYIDSGRTDKAFRILRKLELQFPISLYYYVLSKLFYSVGEREKGYSSALKGIRLSPRKAAPFIEVVERFDSLDEAKLVELVEESELSPPVVERAVNFWIEKGEVEKAISLLKRFWERGKFDPGLFEIYIRVLWESGKRKKVAEEIMALLSKLEERRKIYKCESCGFRTNTFDWICPKCRSWETLEIECEV